MENRTFADGVTEGVLGTIAVILVIVFICLCVSAYNDKMESLERRILSLEWKADSAKVDRDIISRGIAENKKEIADSVENLMSSYVDLCYRVDELERGDDGK